LKPLPLHASIWDFEPGTLRIKQETILSVVEKGGEPHTLTEVAHFGGGLASPTRFSADSCDKAQKLPVHFLCT
jgi:hypothetical protein